MGLLRRAGLAVLGQQQAAREAQSPRGEGGLRHRSLRLLEGGSPVAPVAEDLALPPAETAASPASPTPQAPPLQPTAAEPPSAASAADILASLRAIPDTVELPSHVFGVLKDCLAIRRGALLLYDPVRMVYAPWASCGLDQTTLRRLRISLGALATFNALANGKALVVEGGEALAEYQKHFSSREFSSLERLVLAPFIAEEKLVGVLLVAEAGPPFDDPRLLCTCLDEVANAASPAMRKARGETMKAGPGPAPGPHVPLPDQVARFLAAPRTPQGPVLFFSVRTAGFERTVLDAHPYLDPFRLHEDIRYFVGTFASDLGAAFDLPGGNILLALRGVDPRSVDLVAHQLASFLSSLFGSYGGQGEGLEVLATRIYPDSGADPAALAAHFAS